VFQQDAVVWTGTGLHVVSRDLPVPRGSEVLLRLDAIGLCSSDFHIWCGRKSARAGVLGHEGAGTVVAVGERVKEWSPGDFAIVNPLLNCGRCDACQRSLGHICPDREIVGYNGIGLTATAQVLDARCLVAPPPDFPRQHGSLVEPLACVIHGQRRLDLAVPEETMLILGCGPMGVMHAAFARVRGVRRVWMCDRDPAKLDLAQSKGVPADEWIPLSRLAAAVDDLTAGRGADVTVIANSMRDGHQPAVELTRAGGSVLAFASILDAPGPLALPDAVVDSDDIHRREDRVEVATLRGPVTIVGCIGFDAASFAAAVRLVPHIDGSTFITAVRRLEDVPSLVAGEWTKHLKIVIYPRNGSQSGAAHAC
jgi:threonine dehydrogenase-like Zn-dependent dehydrogenase